jgi:hypothetical protein
MWKQKKAKDAIKTQLRATFVLMSSFSQTAWTNFLLRRYQATRSIAANEHVFPSSPSSSQSLESAVMSRALVGGWIEGTVESSSLVLAN